MTIDLSRCSAKKLTPTRFAADTRRVCVIASWPPSRRRALQPGVGKGYPVYTIDPELPRGTSRAIVLCLSESAGTGPTIAARQPLVRAVTARTQGSRLPLRSVRFDSYQRRAWPHETDDAHYQAHGVDILPSVNGQDSNCYATLGGRAC